jgi:hypothetical protein
MAINRSRNAADHIGFLTLWALDAHRKKRFPLWTKDEILSESYVQTHRLLTTVYDPDKSTVVTFLKGFLWGAVHYAYWTSNGFRFTEDGPRLKLQVTRDTICEELVTFDMPPLEELPMLTEEEWTIVRLRMNGYTMTRIAGVIGLKSPQSVYNRLVRIRDKFRGEQDGTRDAASSDAEGQREECPRVP